VELRLAERAVLPEGNPQTVIPRALEHVDGHLRRVDDDAVVLDFTRPGRGSYKGDREARISGLRGDRLELRPAGDGAAVSGPEGRTRCAEAPRQAAGPGERPPRGPWVGVWPVLAG
jgi:hypothetical protein